MKRLFIKVIVVGICGFSASGQKLKESQMPAAARAAFQRHYPNTKANWDKEDANYEVNFKKDGKGMSVLIQDGTIVETETMISLNELPALAFDYMNQHYKGIKLKDAARIVKANGEVNYEAEIVHKDIVFDGNGKFLKEEKE